MAHETVPADIAAAIEAFQRSAPRAGLVAEPGPFKAMCDARAALDAAILHHLRGVEEMKAALEAQTSGGA